MWGHEDWKKEGGNVKGKVCFHVLGSDVAYINDEAREVVMLDVRGDRERESTESIYVRGETIANNATARRVLPVLAAQDVVQTSTE